MFAFGICKDTLREDSEINCYGGLFGLSSELCLGRGDFKHLNCLRFIGVA